MYAPSSVHCIMQELSCFQPAHRQMQTNDVIENVAGISSVMNAWILLLLVVFDSHVCVVN